MNGPNRPEQPSPVPTAYFDEKLEQFAQHIDARFAERDVRFDQFARDLDARFAKMDVRFDQFARTLDLCLLKFENRLAWKIVSTIVARTAIFSAVVLIAGVD